MYQARTKASQTVKSFNYCFKVCNFSSRCHSSSSSSISLNKPLSLVKSYATPNYFLNPNKSLDLLVTNSPSHQNPTKVNTRTYNTNVNNNYDQKDGQLRGTIEELDALCKERRLEEAVEVLGLLEQKNVSVDLNRFLSLMNECREAQALEEGKKVHEYLVRSVSDIDVWSYNKIIEMYAKCGSMEDALNVFDKMPQRNVRSWDTMITWFAKNGYGEDAIDMFTDFKEAGFKPDGRIFLSVFTVCSVLGDMKEGLLHFESMSKNYDTIPSMDHYKSIVDMLGSAGYLNEALHFIEKMSMVPSVEIWETLMNNCRVHGDTELGDRCFELIELLDPTRLDEQTKAGLIPIKASDIEEEKVPDNTIWDTSHPEYPKLYSQLRCLKQQMIEVGYIPQNKFVVYDVDAESKEEALLSHAEILALSQGLLSSPARKQIRIIKSLRVCSDCHNALKIISKIVGRLIVVVQSCRRMEHRFENGVCSCGDNW
ncbi:pentatricopeptide repeat-containing protein At4g32450, mitochondrial-like [Rutidosis leptorrhynchoides]|uniref:pentatricopeptide repeat-containing protein At4g32450, mitochondrial-like n=1 Tax=Rutidosis leptorrhynchoides TaxID=125765 RepID=UPI003A99C640